MSLDKLKISCNFKAEMKNLLTIILAAFASLTFGQLNMTQLGYLDLPGTYELQLNDIWGYVDEEGNEYALVGAQNGVSIVDVTDPTNPTEVEWLFGPESVWRDLKTYGDYAYITTEADAGLWILDLSPLPSSTVIPVYTYNGPAGSEWFSAHNCYMADGYLYIFGAGRGNGGVIILDVATDPLNPIEVGVFDNWYCHDGVVQNDTGYFAHIYEGYFSVVDLSDKSSPVLLATAITPTAFSHNIWPSENGQHVFTTDEVSDGYIGSFDISDLGSIKQVDKIQSNPGNNVIPHNTHVKGNYIYTSYYNDGVTVHDITHPHNMVEVANFDTSPLYSTSTFNGCWGVYPFLPSGNILAADREEGLYVLGLDLHQGSYLEGNITELGTGSAINNVQITIDGTSVEDFSNIFGDYAIGTEGEGTVDVTYFKVLYFPQTIPVSFSNGSITTQDVVLEKIPLYNLTVEVLDAATLAPIEGAEVLLQHTYIDHNGVTDAAGQVTIGMYYEDNYQVFGGKWGYHTACFTDTLINASTGTLTLLVDQGVYDDFVFDFGWTASGDAERGHWEREIPVGVSSGANIENPYYDALWDCGDYAYITGNGTSASNNQEVNKGEVVLMSPVFDLTGYTTPHINYTAFFFNRYGALPPDDTLQIYLFNGTDVVLIDQRYADSLYNSKWVASSINVSGMIALTSTMQLMLTLSDYAETENVTEAAFDQFSVTEFSIAETVEDDQAKQPVLVYPNPFENELWIAGVEDVYAEIQDLQGKVHFKGHVQSSIKLDNLASGIYIVNLYRDGVRLYSQKLIRE